MSVVVNCRGESVRLGEAIHFSDELKQPFGCFSSPPCAFFKTF
jgi:hypothetical protein